MFRELTRKNRQLPLEECIRILREEPRGVLSVLGDDGYPYGMPMNYWYDDGDGCIYFHTGRGGHRQDALQKCGKTSFCVIDKGVRKDGEWALTVNSVIVFGKIEIIDDLDAVVDVTTRLSRKFTSDDEYIQKEISQHAHRTLLLRLKPEHICGKQVTES